MKKISLSLLFAVVFAAAASAQLVINELMYNSPENADSLEFIEILNAGSAAVNLEGYSLEVGAATDFVFPAGTTLAPNGLVVVARSTNALQAILNFSTPHQWPAGSLNNPGERVDLLAPDGSIADSVSYLPTAPWPTDAAGGGPSIELCSPTQDNGQGIFWKASVTSTGATVNAKPVFCSPGQPNIHDCLPTADHTIFVGANGFTPANVTIQQGETVLWVSQAGMNNVNGAQSIFPNNPESFTSGAVAAGWLYLHQFNLAGIHNYRSDSAPTTMTGAVTVLAAQVPQVVITEIMYNDPTPQTDLFEYIELHNPTATSQDISACKMSGVDLTFAAGTTIAPGGYLVITVRKDSMDSKFGLNTIQWTGGALTNGGETIKILSPADILIDEVAYTNLAPWPLGAAGQGASIVLCDPSKDNSDAANWVAAFNSTGKFINGIEVFANPGAGCPVQAIASDDSYNVLSGQATTFSILINDFVPAGASSTITIIAQPTKGTAVVDGSTIKYTSNAGYCGPDQLKYRLTAGSSSDDATVNITAVCYPVRSIASVIGENATTGVADSANVFCQLEGTVYGVNLRGIQSGQRFTICDGAGNGIGTFASAKTFGATVAEGDKVTVRGQITQFNGLTQMVLDTIIKGSAGNPLVAPTTVTALDEAAESRLVKIATTLTLVDPAQWTGLGTGFTAVATDGTNTYELRIDDDTDLFSMPAPTNPFTATGIGTQFDATNPFTGGYQLMPRYKGDIKEIVATKNADFSSEIRLAPNPATDVLRIESKIQIDRISVSTAAGRQVLEVKNPSAVENLSLENLPAGVFFATFLKDGAAWTTRFVKI